MCPGFYPGPEPGSKLAKQGEGKMKIYKVTPKNKTKIFAGTPEEIVFQMTEQDFIQVDSNDYMKEVKRRIKKAFALEISVRSGDFERFLRELKRIGLIELQLLYSDEGEDSEI
jgi:hypothetical protein